MAPNTGRERSHTQHLEKKGQSVSSHAATASSGSYDSDRSPRTLLLPLPCALGGPPIVSLTTAPVRSVHPL